MSDQIDRIKELTLRMNKIFDEREWQPFHSPKNLTMTLGSEVGELLDEFRWLTEEESYKISGDKRQNVTDEIGDVFIVLMHLANKLGIDPIDAANCKLKKLEEKYPVELCKGSSEKHTYYSK